MALRFMHIITSLLIGLACNAQTANDIPKISGNKLQEDFTIFKDSLYKIHPSLYRYKSKPELDHLSDSCSASIAYGVSDLQFFATLKLLVSAIQDGHLRCSPSDAMRRCSETQVRVFPLRLTFIGEAPYVICSPKNMIPAGARLLTINNVSLQSINNRLVKYIGSDGAVRTGKFHILGAYFWWYYHMVYGHSKSFIIRYQLKNQTIKTIECPSMIHENIVCTPQPAQKTKNLDALFTGDMTILTIKSFDEKTLTSTGENFPAFLDTVFCKMRTKKSDKLIIDLRRNGGGNDIYGALLYSYLAKNTFHYYKSLETTTGYMTEDSHPNLNCNTRKQIGDIKY